MKKRDDDDDREEELSPSRPDRRSVKQKTLAEKFMNALSPEASSEKKDDNFIEAAAIQSDDDSLEDDIAQDNKIDADEQVEDQIVQSNDSELSAHAVLAKNVESSIENSAESKEFDEYNKIVDDQEKAKNGAKKDSDGDEDEDYDDYLDKLEDGC